MTSHCTVDDDKLLEILKTAYQQHFQVDEKDDIYNKLDDFNKEYIECIGFNVEHDIIDTYVNDYIKQIDIIKCKSGSLLLPVTYKDIFTLSGRG